MEWLRLEYLDCFRVSSERGDTKLPPAVPADLRADIDGWQDYLDHHWSESADWADDATRWWYADEARRIQRELRRVLPTVDVRVSTWPAITEICIGMDYMAHWPVWDREGLTGEDDFDLDAALVDDLLRWAAIWEASVSDEHGWVLGSREDFSAEGRRLQAALQAALGPTYEVGLDLSPIE